MSFGLTETGFSRMRESDIVEALEAAMVAEFGEINLEPDSVFSQLIGTFAAQLASAWEALEALYHAGSPASAAGVAMDNMAAITGLVRIPASPTSVSGAVTGNEGTIVGAGAQASVSATREIFTAIEARTIGRAATVKFTVTVLSVANSTLYRVSINGTNCDFTSDGSATQAEIIAGLVSAINGSAAPCTAVDNGPGTSFTVTAYDPAVGMNVDVDPQVANGSERLAMAAIYSPQTFESVNTGKVLALTGRLDTIETPVSGWTGVTNFLDGTLGRDLETDTDLRIRRLLAIRLAGKATLLAMQSALLTQVDGVTSVKMFENRGDAADAEGRPPHCVEAVVIGGADQDILDKVWEVKPAGIETHGNVTGTVEDSNGDDQTIKFSRPVNRYAWIQVSLVLNSEEDFPDNGIQAVIDELLAYGLTVQIGQDFIFQRLYGPIYRVAGIATASVQIAVTTSPGGSPSYGTSNVPVAHDQVLVFDSARISVVVP